MKRILYRKTDSGMEVVSVTGDPVIPELSEPVPEYAAHFIDVPLYNGHRWTDYSVAEIIAKFDSAVPGLLNYDQAAREQTIKAFGQRSRVIQWWNKRNGWTAPVEPTLKTVAEAIIARCERLAEWADKNQHRPFYAGSDMRDFIDKPRAVAAYLQKKYLQ